MVAEFIWLIMWSMAGTCYHENEVLGSINRGKFLEFLKKNLEVCWFS